jgi:hypothetical protein
MDKIRACGTLGFISFSPTYTAEDGAETPQVGLRNEAQPMHSEYMCQESDENRSGFC